MNLFSLVYFSGFLTILVYMYSATNCV